MTVTVPPPLASDPDVPCRPRAVVVDDDDGLRELLELTLRRGGFDVVGRCGDGGEALEVVRRERPDLVLSDLIMPGLDGFALARRLRAEAPGVVIAMLTGTPDTHVPERAAAAGVDVLAFKHEGLARLPGRLHAALAVRATV